MHHSMWAPLQQLLGGALHPRVPSWLLVVICRPSLQAAARALTTPSLATVSIE